MKNSIKKIESKILKLKSLLEDLDLKLDNLEQYGRLNCLFLHGSGIEYNQNYNKFLKHLTCSYYTK